MSKEDCIEVTGTVVEKFPSGQFSVLLDQDRSVLAHLAGRLRRNRIACWRRPRYLGAFALRFDQGPHYIPP